MAWTYSTEGAPITVDTYSYLSEAEWVNHHWLGNVAMGWLYAAGSSAALAVGKAFLAMLVVVVLVWRLVSLKVPMVRVALVILAAVVLLTPTLGTFRPQVFTVVLSMTLFLIMISVEKGNSRMLYVLPVLFLAWANLHGGFFAGIGHPHGLVRQPFRVTEAAGPAAVRAGVGTGGGSLDDQPLRLGSPQFPSQHRHR